MRFILLFFMILVFHKPALAQCTNPDGVRGELMFNGTHEVFQGCTAQGWKAFHRPSGATGCDIIGTPCRNKTIYAGNHPISGKKLYVAPIDAPTKLEWGPIGSPTFHRDCSDPSPDDACHDGIANTATLAQHESTLPAVEYCANLAPPDSNALGYDDWYLPSIHELVVIFTNLKKNKPAGTHGFKNNYYWSSSEQSHASPYVMHFTGEETITWISKTNTAYIRCVRQ